MTDAISSFANQGMKCGHRLCRVCCKNRCYHGNQDCVGHKIFIKSRRDKAKMLTEKERQAAKGNEDGQPSVQHNGQPEKMDVES